MGSEASVDIVKDSLVMNLARLLSLQLRSALARTTQQSQVPGASRYAVLARDLESRLSGFVTVWLICVRLNPEQHGWSDQTSPLRLSAATCHRRTGAACRGMSPSSYILVRQVFDVLAGWKRKPFHPFATFASIPQNSRGSQKTASVHANG
jgi:hypothetical protein